MIIVDEVYDDFLARYSGGVAALRTGDLMDAATTLVPLTSQATAGEVKEKIRQAVAYDAVATEVGPKIPTKSAFVQLITRPT